MTDAQKLIRDVLTFAVIGDTQISLPEAETLAAEVDKALGGLTREWAGRIGVTDSSRFVGRWQAVET